LINRELEIDRRRIGHHCE